MPAGRPTDYRPEYCERVIELGRLGMSVVEMAADIGVARNTLEQLWPAANPEFLQALHHEASAERHDALATMHRARIERLAPISEIQHKNNVIVN